MKYIALVLLATPAFAENEIHRNCLAKYDYKGLQEINAWSDIATCIVTEKNKIRFKEEDRIWQFVQDNPHYRYPGVALPAGEKKPLSPYWGKGRYYKVD